MDKKKPGYTLEQRTISVKIVNKDDLWKFVGSNIAEARRLAGITQEQLAGMLGMTRTSLANLEAGRQRSPLDVLYDAAAYCGTTIERILPL